MYDFIIVGARCAGSPTAMLLARKGFKVLLVDRATFPSDTISTHILWPHGAEILARWGLLGTLAATGAPPICRRMTFDVGPFALRGAIPDANDGMGGFCPRRTVLDSLLANAAAEAGVEVREGFIVDELLITDDARLDGAISERLGRRGRLAVTTAPDVKRPYVASPCHLLTSATLKALSAAYPSGRFVSQRFRPNVTLDCGDAVGFLETDWIGRSLKVGPLAMKGTEHCLRCALTTRPQGDLPKDPGILHTAQQHNENRVGIYANIAAPGRMRPGDVARLEG